ncbi:MULTISPECIES: carbon-nitrogen hydrolase family protein [Pseudomonas]|uniref:Carbon-nitrogen hydrolase family protein n=2 Tax=Pseudomonas gessardii TaxID=78544 RepID=A0A7Y1MTD5_9PSED|nr:MULTISPECIES: carbon-nitrogen hydrolase family protein [Pseudomonas]MBH3424292.1 carbon-nitrogen hydrolase family protein [Pseudomonas gessardii]MCF4979854.1 nitrilase [Pseudomonas gessardii]MCF4990761.1 nitrilase [Pseudomonas gessardii]MCF5087950.1 nitrilase [Pseudomonas gessardii]MCF5095078.1 nitrilase [Pseudomonas gessardii]
MFKAAVVQASSIPFEPYLSAEKAAGLIREAAEKGAALVVFPEAFLGGYPKGAAFGTVVGSRNDTGRAHFQRYMDGSITQDGPELARLGEVVNETGVHVVMGIIERVGRTLYCSSVTLAPGKGIAGYHRKLMPTGQERIIWGFGDGSSIAPVDTPLGRIGTVICWENYMPALRQAMYAQGTEIYCTPTADDRPTWASSMVHIAVEGRVHVLSACQAITLAEYPAHYRDDFALEAQDSDYIMHGGSMIVSPAGQVLAGPVFDQETILYADIDLSAGLASNLDFDVCGHYSRPEVFQLKVNTAPMQPVVFDAS